MAILYSKNGIKIVSLEYFKLDLLSPGTKKTTDQSNIIRFLGRKFGITTEQQGSHSWFIRELMDFEMMKFYSIYIPSVSHIDSQTVLGTILDHLLSYRILRKLRRHATEQLFNLTNNVCDLVYSNNYHQS